MDLAAAIDVRTSRRRYLPTPVDAETRERLDALAAELSGLGPIKVEPVWNNGVAFAGFTKSYGMFNGVINYLALLAPDDEIAGEQLGYYGETMVLAATELGLGTCWVGGSFSRSDIPFQPDAGDVLYCVIALGNVSDDVSLKERILRSAVHRKTKTVEEMYDADGPVPDWFEAGMIAVQKAPSAVNRQPVKFHFRDGKVTATTDNLDDRMRRLDFGIAKRHFEIGAGGGTWAWGNGGEFTPDVASQ